MPQESYGINNAIRDAGASITRDVSRYHALPPLKKNHFRAGAGTG